MKRLSHSPFVMLSLALLAQALDAPLLARQPQASSSAARDGYLLAFSDADVKRVVDAILGAMLAVDYSIDPAVTGNVTLRTAQPVPRDQLVPLLESALKSVGAALLVDGRSYRIVRVSDARARAPIAANSNDARNVDAPILPGFASQVFTLQHGSAREISKMLTQFLGKDVVTAGDDGLNQITISGTAEERQAARDLIKRFDIDTLSDMHFELYRLDNVDATSLLGELERIFKPPFDIIGTRVRIVPLPRLRSVLAIAADRNDITRIEPWIRRLDVGVSGKRKLYSYAVQNGRAKELATALQQVLGAQGSGGEAKQTVALPDGQMAESTKDDSSSTQVEGSAASSTSRQSASSTSAALKIVPNDATNALLIYADGEEYEFIKEALQKLDQPVAQVLIEATLAEVTLTNDLRYGVNFRAIDGNKTIINSATTSATPASSLPGFSASVVGSSVSAVLNSLQSKTNVRVLSAPKLIVLNNQTATLQVGDQVPIVTQQQQSIASPGAPVVNTVEMRDTGVILKVTPRVNESGVVTLDISQEVSDVAQTTTSGINSPTIQQRRLSSTVSTRTGQMIALGGLIRDRVTRTRTGIPLLSQIPIIGAAFGSTSTGGGRTELIILLTPTVIRSPEEAKTIVDALIDGLDAARPLVDRAKAHQVNIQPLGQIDAPR